MNTQEKTFSTANIKKDKKYTLPLICAAYTLLALYLPTVLFLDMELAMLQGLSIVSAVLSIFAFSRLSGITRSAVSYSLILVLVFAFAGVLLCGIAASFIGSVLILAYLMITIKRPALKLAALLPALVAYLAAAVLLGDFVLPIAALFHIPTALLLAYSFGRGQDRISVICKTSFGMIASVTAVAVSLYAVKYGTDLSVLSGAIESAKNYLTELLANAMYTIYGELGEISLTDARALSSAAVNVTFNLLPAIAVIAANVVSFLLQSLMINIFIHTETDKERIRAMTLFDMSLVSAIVFLLAFLLSALSPQDELSVWSVTAENIALILMPGLVLTAILALRRFTFGKRGSCGGVIIYFVIIFLMFNLPSIMLTLASFAGAVIVILNNITIMLNNKKNKIS